MNIREIDAEIARLANLKKAAQDEANKAGKKALAALELEWEWRIEWKNDYAVRVERRLLPHIAEARRAIIDAHPGMYVSSLDDVERWHGMTYIITRGDYIEGGGGHCLLDANSGFGHNPRKLSPDELQALLDCGPIPDSLLYKSPY